MENKVYILSLFKDLLIIKNKISFHVIAQEIIDTLSDINYFDIQGAFSKEECISLFQDSEYTWGGSTTLSNKNFAESVRDNVDSIL